MDLCTMDWDLDCTSSTGGAPDSFAVKWFSNKDFRLPLLILYSILNTPIGTLLDRLSTGASPPPAPLPRCKTSSWVGLNYTQWLLSSQRTAVGWGIGALLGGLALHFFSLPSALYLYGAQMLAFVLILSQCLPTPFRRSSTSNGRWMEI